MASVPWGGIGAGGWWLFGILTASTLVLLLALTAERFVRDGRSRRLILVCAFGSLIGVPILHGLGAVWVPPLPTAIQAGRVSEGASSSRLPVADPAFDISDATSAAGSHSPSTSGTLPPAFRSFLAAGFLTWLVGGASVLAYRVVGIMMILHLIRNATPASRRVRMRAAAVARDIGFPDPVRVLRSPKCSTPMVWSLPRPTILLPFDTTEWSESTWRSVFLHEIVHLRSRDASVRLVALVVSAFYWPQPLVWFASSRLRSAQELACDRAVLDTGLDTRDYANALVSLARSGRRPARGHVGLALISERPGLRRRVEHILRDDDPSTSTASRPGRYATVWMAMFFVLGGASFAPRTADANEYGRAAAFGGCSIRVGEAIRSVRVVVSGATSVHLEGSTSPDIVVSSSATDPVSCPNSAGRDGDVVIRSSASGLHRLRVELPRYLSLTVRADTGTISVRDLDGVLDVQAKGGDVSLVRVTGGGRVGTTESGGIGLRLEGGGWTGSPLQLQSGVGPIVVMKPDGYRARLVNRSEDGSPTVRLHDPVGDMQIIEFPEETGKRVRVTPPEEGT